MPILGLVTAESYAANRFTSVRRSVFYWYPQGAAPLMGLLSLLKEETCDDPEFAWWEKRHKQLRTTLANISTTVVIYTRDAATGGTYTTAAANVAVAAATTGAASFYGLKVVDASVFRVHHQFKVNVINSTGATVEMQGIVTEVDTANNRITFRSLTTVTFDFDAANAGAEILVIGNSYEEGMTNDSRGRNTVPYKVSNYTQIFRTPFDVTGTALKTSLMYDKAGPYNDLAKENSVNNMIEMEFAFLFGTKTLYTGGSRPQRTTGGVLYWLNQWEQTSNNLWGEAGVTNTGTAAGTGVNDDLNKKIIDFNDYGVQANTLTDKRYDDLLLRLFRVTNNKANEKLVLCGDGFLGVVNRLYKSMGVLNTSLPMTDTYGMDIVAHRTPWGRVYYRTHPLFSQNASMRYNALFLDVNNLNYTYLEGRDTTLLKNRQANDADIRTDEWLGECGLELHFPDSHMYLKNVLSEG